MSPPSPPSPPRAPAEPLLSAADARRRLADAWPAAASERVALGQAAGRVLAEPLVSPEDLPSCARSAMDGYAVPAALTRGARAEQPVALTLGQQAWAIATGGPVPPGADAVVMVEQTRSGVSEVEIHVEVSPGRNVLAQGEDVRAGAALWPAGRRLSIRDLALLGAVGLTSVAVVARRRVAVLSSGAELVRPGEAVLPGQVRDVNQPSLAAAARAAGALVTPAGIVTDAVEAVAAALQQLSGAHDVVLISGGTSVGLADHTAQALRQLGARLLFHGLAIRPGRPTLAARLGDSLVVGLPGVPAAALIVYELFVRDLLEGTPGEDRRVSARLTEAVSSSLGREDYVRVGLHTRPDGLWAAPVPGAPASLFALATADGVAVVPHESGGLAAGDRITVLRF